VTDYLLAGRYRLTDRIAAGGMGEVWRGEDVLLNRAVAVKLLPTGRAGDESFLARFRAEARYSASLSHPGIARVYDYGESAEFGGAYLIMELVQGEPLSAILARAGRLSPDATLDIIGQAARALDAAHQAGIVHRDIKPGNLLVAGGGTTKITDFGIATAVRAAQASHLTETGMVMGTAMYVSPEQATGAPVDSSSDIYSLGVVAYECLSGHVPFMASEPLAIAYAHKHAPVPALPPDVPQPVADLVYDMLAKTPAGRPASARAVADRADMLREALALAAGGARLAASGGGRTGEFAGATRADLPAAPTGVLRPAGYDPAGYDPAGYDPAGYDPAGYDPGGYDPGLGPRPSSSRRRWTTAGLTAVLCAAAAATGLYLSGHIHGQTSGDVGNTVQHLSSPAAPSSVSTSQAVTISPTPSTVEQPSKVATTSVSPKPSKSTKPTSSPKISPSSSASSSASSSTSASASSSSSTSASASASSSSPTPTS
jgi:eukaryotic-like serine/threonine-protein kinase